MKLINTINKNIRKTQNDINFAKNKLQQLNAKNNKSRTDVLATKVLKGELIVYEKLMTHLTELRAKHEQNVKSIHANHKQEMNSIRAQNRKPNSAQNRKTNNAQKL